MAWDPLKNTSRVFSIRNLKPKGKHLLKRFGKRSSHKQSIDQSLSPFIDLVACACNGLDLISLLHYDVDFVLLICPTTTSSIPLPLIRVMVQLDVHFVSQPCYNDGNPAIKDFALSTTSRAMGITGSDQGEGNIQGLLRLSLLFDFVGNAPELSAKGRQGKASKAEAEQSRAFFIQYEDGKDN